MFSLLSRSTRLITQLCYPHSAINFQGMVALFLLSVLSLLSTARVILHTMRTAVKTQLLFKCFYIACSMYRG